MKRVVVASSKGSILKKIQNDLKQQGRDARLNADHHCVDVYEDGHIVEQHYAEEKPDKQIKQKFRYREALPEDDGPRYVRVYYDSKVKDYTDVDHLVKYVSRTNKDNRYGDN